MKKSKSSSNNGKKKCRFSGCRKFSVSLSDFCRDHSAQELEKAQFPVDYVEKISETDALKFRALDAEIRNHLQGMRLMDFEIQESERKYQEEQRTRLSHKTELQALVDMQRVEYEGLVNRIAKEHGMDPKMIAIDPEARTIRDLRNESVNDVVSSVTN